MTEPIADTPMPEDSKPPEALLAELRERYPKTFHTNPAVVVPLAVKIHKKLVAAGYNRQAVAEALGLYVSSPAYLAALAAGTRRIDLGGEPAGEVTEAHRQFAREQMENPAAAKPRIGPVRLAGKIDKPQQQKKPMPQIELAAVQAKIAFTIDAETFRAALDVDSAGAKSVQVSIAVDGKKYAAQLNPKSFRKAQAAFREAANPVVSISGNIKGGAVESAGIQVFDKAAKAAAE